MKKTKIKVIPGLRESAQKIKNEMYNEFSIDSKKNKFSKLNMKLNCFTEYGGDR